MKTEDDFTPERDVPEKAWPDKAWAQLADLTAMMAALFGRPEAIAARKVLLAKVRQKILRWLAPLEALARRLLLLDATKLPLPNVKAAMPSAPIVSALRDGSRTTTLSDNPADWRVIFNVCPGGAPRQNRQATFAHKTAREDAGGPNHNALPLARRMEALLRVVRDRKACVQRMARLLAARREHVRSAFAPYRPARKVSVGPVDCLLDQVQRRIDLALSDTS